MSERIQEP